MGVPKTGTQGMKVKPSPWSFRRKPESSNPCPTCTPWLLKELQQESNLGLIFITHDFGIVAKMWEKWR